MKKIGLILVFLTIGSHIIMANTGTIEGTVIDLETGSPLPGTNVTVQSTSLGAAADQAGQFEIQNVPVGHYVLKASMMGYQQEMATDVAVEAKRATQVVFELKQKVITTEPITVASSYFNRYSDAVISTHTLSAREIRSSPGSAEDVFRILKNIPGVSTTGSKSANLIVRGGDRNENLTLLDNIEIKSPLHFSREDMSMGVISIIDPALIKNVEFLTGGFPAEYGDKLSSVFSLKVKEGNRTQMNRDINLNMAGFNIYLDGPLWNNGSMVFSIRRGIFDLFTKMMGQKVQPRYWDMLGKITYDIGSQHKLSLIGFYYRDDAEREQKMEDHGQLARRYEYMKWNDYGAALGLNWRYLYSDRGYAVTTLEWTGNGNLSNIGYLTNRDLNGDDNLSQNIQLKTKISYKISPQLILTGGAYLKRIASDYHRWREPDTLKTGFIVPVYQRVYNLPDSYQKGVYLQSSVRPFGRLMILPGIRFDTYDLTNESYWSPRLGLLYHLTEKLTLNASWGLYYQTPSPLFLSMDLSNLKLKSSRSMHSVIGIEYLLSHDTRFSIEVYDKDIENAFVDSDTMYEITNDGSGYSKGFELTIQKKMSAHLMGSMAYTLSRSRRQDGASLPEYDFDYDRLHNVTAMLAYRLSDTWQIGVKYQYASGNPYTPVVGSVQRHDEWFVLEGEKNSARFPDYHSLDIRVDRAFRFSGWTLTAYLEVWNLFNRKNILDYYYDVDDKGQVTKNSVADFPLMPMLGFSAQF